MQRNQGVVERGRQSPLGERGTESRREGTGERKEEWRGKVSSNAGVTRLVLSLVPKEACRVGHTSPSAIQLFLFFASVHSATPRHATAMPLPDSSLCDTPPTSAVVQLRSESPIPPRCASPPQAFSPPATLRSSLPSPPNPSQRR